MSGAYGRLKLGFPHWRIRRHDITGDSGPGRTVYSASRGDVRLQAASTNVLHTEMERRAAKRLAAALTDTGVAGRARAFRAR